jgi:predicted nuclease with TOPRIM domain
MNKNISEKIESWDKKLLEMGIANDGKLSDVWRKNQNLEESTNALCEKVDELEGTFQNKKFDDQALFEYIQKRMNEIDVRISQLNEPFQKKWDDLSTQIESKLSQLSEKPVVIQSQRSPISHHFHTHESVKNKRILYSFFKRQVESNRRSSESPYLATILIVVCAFLFFITPFYFKILSMRTYPVY